MDRHKNQRKKLLIIGGGFAGINAALEASKLPLEVTLVDRNNHHTFQPLLYQVAMSMLSPADIAQPLRTILRHCPNVTVLMDEVIGFDLQKHSASLKSGVILPYDYLIVATGATHSYFGHDEWAAIAPGLKSLEDAIEIRRRVLLAFELAERAVAETGSHPELNFVIVGAGPTGVELSGAISDLTRLYMKKDFRLIDLSKTRILLLEGTKHVLGAYPSDLSLSARRQLEALGVTIRLNTLVTDIQPGYVMIGNERIESSLTLWAAGVLASPLGKLLGAETDRKGCVFVDGNLNPEGHPEVFVCGDLARVIQEDGRILPGVAQPAMQMGRYAAQRVGKLLSGASGANAGPVFRYHDKGDMATIGRKAAIANITWPFKAHWSALPAWMAWLLVHIFFLIGFRNRISVFIQWAWTYIMFRDGARLIMGSKDLPGWRNTSVPGAAVHDPAQK